MKFTVALKNTSNVRLSGITLSVACFVVENEKSTPKTQEFAFAFDPNQERNKTIDLGDTVSLDSGISITLKKGNGNIIKQLDYVARDVTDKTLTIEFNSEENPSMASTAPSRPLMVYGRLLDVHGKQKMEDVQIIVLAKRTDTAPLTPIESFKTEAQGYFSFNYPEGEFKEAYAQIGLELTGNPLLINLEPSSSQSNALVFPKRLILMAGLAKPTTSHEEDCDCGCNSLHFEDKRVLEEFSFYSVVRTTEPEIKGYVIEEEDEITLEEVIGRLPVSQLDIYDTVKNLRFAKEDPVIKWPFKGGWGNPSGGGGEGKDDNNSEILKNIRNLRIQKKVLVDFLKEEKTVSTQNIDKLLELNDASKLQDELLSKQRTAVPLGRVTLNANNNIDWDDEPTIYQAVEIAHGHLLQYKSEWIADGFSLGDLLYSLPLAPGQKKQIVVFDWERRESASNSQSVDFEESLSNSLSRDRDILEVVKGSVAENMSGRSSANTAGVGAGASGASGSFLMGIAGGWGHSSSNASQSSLRQTSASDLQRLRDRTVQSANAVRSLRSTVIQTVSQGERFEVSSESIANYNHCHAITIQYYEVLRHFKIRQRFAGARECLFVPLLMRKFDLKKALRWREALQSAIIDQRQVKAFDAGDRVSHEWKDSNFPDGTYASEKILSANGLLKVKLKLQRPADNSDEKATFNLANWQGIQKLLSPFTAEDFYEAFLKESKNKDGVFHRELGERVARVLVDNLIFEILNESGGLVGILSAEATLTSRYYIGGTLNITLRAAQQTSFQRDQVHYLRIKFNDNISNAVSQLPAGTSIIVQSASLRYRTRHFNGTLFDYKNIGDDLTANDFVTLYAGPSDAELRDPRKDDLAMVNKLVAHLNDNLEYYHKAIWLRMTPERRFMLLDGITIPPDRPESKGGGRSVASLVENELIGIVGNSLVLPVASGLNLDPNFSTDKQSLGEYYMITPAEPISVSIPTKGVFAEAVMGNCNACEKIDESRFWRWEESPIPDSPTAINPINTDSRRADPGNLQPQAMPAPIVNIQNAPNAPDPTGLAATMGLLGQSNLFKDITGLEGNQKNAMQAMQSSLDTAKAFGQQAANLEIQKTMERRLDKVLNAIEDDPSMSPEKKAELKEKAINAYLGAGATKEEKKEKEQPKPSLTDAAIRATEQGRNVKANKTDATGNNESIEITGAANIKPLATVSGFIPNLKQPTDNTCWATAATIMMSWKRGKMLSEEGLLAEIGNSYLQMFQKDEPLPANQKDAFIAALNMVGEPPASYPLQQYIDWVNSYGPLWITTDSSTQEGLFSPHAKILVKITGSGSEDGIGTDFTFIDPASKRQNLLTVVSFNDFLKSYEAMVTDNEGDLFIQIVHFKDKKQIGEGRVLESTSVTEIDELEIPTPPTLSFERNFEYIKDNQLGLEVRNPQNLNKDYWAKQGPWKLKTGNRETLKGEVTDYKVSTNHDDQDEYDWNITIDLSPGFADKFAQNRGVVSGESFFKSNEILCEVTPSDNFRLNDWFRIGGTTLSEKEICVYGPWVLDEGNPSDNNKGQEIHPIDAIWWKVGEDTMLMLLQDAAKYRFRKKTHFTMENPPAGWDPDKDPNIEPWVKYPQKEEILIPFIYEDSPSGKCGEYDIIKIDKLKGDFIDFAHKMPVNGTKHRLVIKKPGNECVAVEVIDAFGVVKNLRIDFQDVYRVGSSSDNVMIKGYVRIRIDVGQPGDPSQGFLEEGYLVMKISRSKGSN